MNAQNDRVLANISIVFNDKENRFGTFVFVSSRVSNHAPGDLEKKNEFKFELRSRSSGDPGGSYCTFVDAS